MKTNAEPIDVIPKCYDDCAFYYEHDYGDCLILYHLWIKGFTYEDFPAYKECKYDRNECKYYRSICELEKYLGINHEDKH